MRERGPKTKPRMDVPKAKNKSHALPREAKNMLMKEYQAKERDKAQRYSGPGEQGAQDEKKAVQQVQDTMTDGAQGVGRGTINTMERGRKRFIQNQQSKKARRQYVADKTENARHTAQAASGNITPDNLPNVQIDNAFPRIVDKGGGASPKGKAGAVAPKSKKGTAVSKLRKPTAKTSKKALAMGKAGRVGAVQQEVQRQTAKAAQAASKKAAQAAKRMAQMVFKAAKAVATAVTTILAACGPFLMIVIAIAGVLMVIASPFGLFYSKEDTGAGVSPISAVIRDVAADFNQQIKEIKDSNTWDELQVHYEGERGNNWKDVLAIFAVKTTLFDEDAMDVVTIDEARAGCIRAVFWDMTELSHRIETVEHYDIETDTTTYTYILHITITSRAATTQAGRYGFTTDQNEILAEMLSGAYDEFFRDLIGGAGELGGGTDVIGTANYIWPSDSSSRVTSYFGSRPHPVTGEPDDHYGIDIGAGHGTNVLAADGGRVVTAEWHWSYGNYIIIDHGGGNRTLYAHMSLLIAHSGQEVAQGEVIGLVGDTGMVDGAHIHFETHTSGGRVDPLSYFSGHG